MQVSEKDLNQAAAYLLKEQDEFSLFSTDVEGAFQKARQTADDFKAQILTADLNHNTPSDVSAELLVMVDPAQIEPFLAQVRMLGRVANFTRQTQRVAQDGGDSSQPADQTLTEKDKVQVHVTIRSDDESRKQVALTVVTPAVDDALDRAKSAALAAAGTEILSSSLNKTPEGQSTAQMSLRVPGKEYQTLLGTLRALGRTASFSLQRDDNAGPGADGDDAPVIISLALTDDDEPLQETNLSVLATDVDAQSQQIKKDAAAAGVAIKSSDFSRQPDGIETAQLVFRLPMANYPAFIENLKKLGKVESLTVQRQDRPDQARADDTAPVEISLQLHNQRDIVTEDNGLWATLRGTFGDGAAALFGSVRTIGVIIAFLAPWVFTLLLAAWIGRRIYLWRKK
jgi:VCBS repeat-containing protein